MRKAVSQYNHNQVCNDFQVSVHLYLAGMQALCKDVKGIRVVCCAQAVVTMFVSVARSAQAQAVALAARKTAQHSCPHACMVSIAMVL